LEPGPEELPSQDFNSVLGFRVSFEIATSLGFHHLLPHRGPHISGNKQNHVSAPFNTLYHFGPRIHLKTSYVRNWRKHGTTVTIEAAQKKLGDLVDGTSASSEQAQQTMVDGITPFALSYQYIFCRIIT